MSSLYLASFYDLNDDHVLDQQDYTLLNIVVSKSTQCPMSRSCDLTGDGTVNTSDIQYLGRYLKI